MDFVSWINVQALTIVLQITSASPIGVPIQLNLVQPKVTALEISSAMEFIVLKIANMENVPVRAKIAQDFVFKKFAMLTNVKQLWIVHNFIFVKIIDVFQRSLNKNAKYLRIVQETICVLLDFV